MKRYSKGFLMSWVNWLRLLIGLAVVVLAVAAVLWQEQVGITDIRDGFAALGIWAPLVFVVIYTLATVVSLPGPVLTLTGGMLFGALWGTMYSLIGATAGAALAFWLADQLGRAWVERNIGPRIAPIKHGVEDEGWRFVLFARLMPVVPYGMLNYALGLTRIRLLPYTLASFVGMLPATFVYSYLGDASVRVLEGEEAVLRPILFAIAAVAALVFLPRLIKRIRAHQRRAGDS